MSSLTYRWVLLFYLLLVANSRSVIGNIVHDETTDNIDDIFEDITDDLTETRLRHWFHKIDSDVDEQISTDELKTWVSNIRKTHAMKITKERMTEYDRNNDEVVSMNEYFDAIYGTENENLGATKEMHDMLSQSKEQDKTRWKYADFNHDEKLSLDELAAFENPEDYQKMKDYNVDTTFWNLDTNKDGKISMDEYLGSDPSSSVAAEEVDFRKRYFKILKDRNRDGHLDMAEVKKWLHHSYPSRIDIETNGFMEQMDGNRDGMVDKQEIVHNWDKVNKNYPNFQSILLEHEEL